ncbi:hypothetical protein [Ornithinimicrobium kibberense]|uniref:hypothetical protein n=1 Tax=Ornithinimicrobium kibberense TaxID=282060 RepID=UPI003609F25B
MQVTCRTALRWRDAIRDEHDHREGSPAEGAHQSVPGDRTCLASEPSANLETAATCAGLIDDG